VKIETGPIDRYLVNIAKIHDNERCQNQKWSLHRYQSLSLQMDWRGYHPDLGHLRVGLLLQWIRGYLRNGWGKGS